MTIKPKKRPPLLHIRLEDGLEADLKKEAKSQGRTVTNLINYIIKQFFSKEK